MLRFFTVFLIGIFFSFHLQGQALGETNKKNKKAYFAFAYAYGKDKTLLISNVEEVSIELARGQKERSAILAFRSANKPHLINYLKGNYKDIFNPAFDYSRIKTFEIGADREALLAIYDQKVEKSGEHHLLMEGFDFLRRDIEGPVPRRSDMH
jgi:hypothetical protein